MTIQILKCLIGIHDVYIIRYCIDGKLIVCKHCLKVKEINFFNFKKTK